MKMEINALGFDITDALEQHIKHRSRFAFSKFSDLDLYVRFTLFDDNGPRGGEDMCAHLYLGAPGIKKTVIKEQQSDLYRAIERAIHRAERALSRKLARRRVLSRKLHPILSSADGI